MMRTVQRWRICVDSGQEHPGRFRHRRAASSSVEPSNQAKGFRFSAHSVPRNPDAVGIAQARFAVMPFQLIRRKHKFLQWCDHFRRLWVAVKRVDHELSVDLDRIGFALFVEVNPSTKAPHSGLARLV